MTVTNCCQTFCRMFPTKSQHEKILRNVGNIIRRLKVIVFLTVTERGQLGDNNEALRKGTRQDRLTLLL